MTKQQLTKLRKISNTTFKEITTLLTTEDLCLIWRPVGFGKTYLMAKLAKNYDRVLFLSPRKTLEQETKTKYPHMSAPNVEFMQYQTFCKLPKKNKNWTRQFLARYDLVLCDEAHRCGGAATLIALTELIAMNKTLDKKDRLKIVGATATPFRPDNIDIFEVFDNKLLSEYTSDDAFRDGICQMPDYFYAVQTIDEDMAILKSQLIGTVTDPSVISAIETELSNFNIKYNTAINAQQIIKDKLDQYAPNAKKLKVLVFYPTTEALDRHVSEIESWYKYARPNMKVNTHIITTKHRAKASDVLDITTNDGEIDLILSIDMLDTGIHIDDLTDIVFLRKTGSLIKYGQMYGRGVSVDSDSPCRIFDLVANLTNKPLQMYAFGEKDSAGRQRKTNTPVNNPINVNVRIIDEMADYQDQINKLSERIALAGMDSIVDLYDRGAPIAWLSKHFHRSDIYIAQELYRRGYQDVPQKYDKYKTA